MPDEGTYALPEFSAGTFTLRASRSDTNIVPKTVSVTLPLDTVVDFTLYYKIWGQFQSPSSPYISTANGAVTRSVVISTYAPTPGQPGESGKSCVYITDSRTGITSAASFASYDSVSKISTWTHALTLSQNTPENFYQLSLVAKDCSSGLILTVTPLPTVWYVVDNTLPVIDRRSITPLDHGNAIFSSQPLFAKVTEAGGAGISPSGITFAVTDDGGTPAVSSDDSTSTRAATSYSSTTKWATTAPLTLVPGHAYRVVVSAIDNAGNSTTASQTALATGGGFLATAEPVLEATNAFIPPTNCSVGPTDALAQRTVTCSHVPLHLDPSAITIKGTRHAGVGFIQHTVQMNGAVFRVGTNGVTSPTPLQAYNGADAAWGARTLSAQFVVLEVKSEDQRVTVAPVDATIGTLTGKIPAVFDEASLELNTTSIPATAACSNVSTASTRCVPDAMRVFLGDREAKILAMKDQAEIEASPMLYQNASSQAHPDNRFSLVYFHVHMPAIDPDEAFCFDTLNQCYPNLPRSYRINDHWQPLAPIGGCAGATCAPCPQDGSVDCYLQYAPTMSTIEPRHYAAVCDGAIVDCYTLDDPAEETPQPRMHSTNNTITDNHEAQKGRVTFTVDYWDWGPGAFPGKESDANGTRDVWHFNGSASIVTQTNDRDYGELKTMTKCDHLHRYYNPPFLCYGFADGRNDDGVLTTWPGTWFELPADGARRYLVAAADFFGDGTACFQNSPTRYGLADERSFATWSSGNYLIEGILPGDVDDGHGGFTNLDTTTKSGGMKMIQEGRFITPWFLGQDYCEWATWRYGIGGDLYQYNTDGNVTPGEVWSKFNHTWTDRQWQWTFSCAPGGCPSAGAQPTNDNDAWEIRQNSRSTYMY